MNETVQFSRQRVGFIIFYSTDGSLCSGRVVFIYFVLYSEMIVLGRIIGRGVFTRCIINEDGTFINIYEY